MKSLIVMTTILFALLQGCNRSNNDQNFQDHHDRQPSSHYDETKDPNINSLSNQPATKEGL
jgi:hypothetical protein